MIASVGLTVCVPTRKLILAKECLSFLRKLMIWRDKVHLIAGNFLPANQELRLFGSAIANHAEKREIQ